MFRGPGSGAGQIPRDSDEREGKNERKDITGTRSEKEE